ncbi:MAG: radical SAM family heme chaperone HemW [Candidatus Dependentiae bacterium]|nr:radical SAM family heme chaperone HemW [Candidatus Dependentiae bacterium]
MLYNHAADARSVYLHWPFCPYKCHFCPFVALASHDQFMGRYHNALTKEIKDFGALFQSKLPLETLYIGGGTPSTYPDDLLLDTFAILKDIWTFDESCEVTIEVNPGTVRVEQLSLWKALGINRLSIGVQSLKDPVLKKLNRHQSAQDVFTVIDQAKDHFDNLSVDFILGLPEVSSADWRDLIQQAVTWPIKHISIYFLMVHEDTPLYFGVKKKAITLPCDDEVVDLYYWTIDYLAQHGFDQYEISNFARAGYESKHNSMYWDRKPYKAFGLGACEFDGTMRLQNQKNLGKYLDGVERGEDITVFSETLSSEQVYLERVMLGLRRSQGVSYQDLMENLSEQRQHDVRAKIAYLQASDFVMERSGRLLLTPKGLAVENDIVVKLSL